MPFEPREIHWSLACGIGPDGHRHGWFTVHVDASALRRLGPARRHPPQTLEDVLRELERSGLSQSANALRLGPGTTV